MSPKYDSTMNSRYNRFIHSEIHMALSITLSNVGQLTISHCLIVTPNIDSQGTVSHTPKQKYFNNIVK